MKLPLASILIAAAYASLAYAGPLSDSDKALVVASRTNIEKPSNVNQAPGHTVSGLPPVARNCANVAGSFLATYYCLQGAEAAVAQVMRYCSNQQGSYSGVTCIFKVLQNAALAGAAGAAIGGFYSSGYGFGDALGQIRTAVGGLLPGKARRDMARRLTISGITGFTPPLNSSLPMMTFADSKRNLSYPFHFKMGDITFTHFPAGHPDDPSFLYTHHLPGYNTSAKFPEMLYQRYKDPGSLGLAEKRAVMPRQEQCIGTTHSLPYQTFYKVTTAPSFGFKLETLATCGHPAKSGQNTQDQFSEINTAVNSLINMNLAVMEYEVTVMANGYTYTNNRMVIETRSFDTCNEGQHMNAYCAN